MIRILHSFDAGRAAARSSWNERRHASACAAGDPSAASRFRLLELLTWTCVTLIGLALLIGVEATAQSGAKHLTINTSNGHRLSLPKISTLETCSQIQDVLDQIDATNYRVGSPDSVKHPDDKKLLMYEDELSEHSYKKCQQREPQGFLGGMRMKVTQ